MTQYELQDMILAQLGKDMSAVIDFQIVADLLTEIGWLEHQLEPWGKANHSVTSWCERHIKGNWTRSGNRFLFESLRDANWFALRWS